MKIAISCVNAEETAGPAIIARVAESLGFEKLFIPEHPVIPVVHRTPESRRRRRDPDSEFSGRVHQQDRRHAS